MREYRDHFGNDVLHFDVLESHDRLSVTAVSEVVTPSAFLGAREAPTPLELYDYLEPDRLRALLRERGRVRRAARG